MHELHDRDLANVYRLGTTRARIFDITPPSAHTEPQEPRTFPGCSGPCAGATKLCPTPVACLKPEASEPLPWLTTRRFWIAYALGIVSALLIVHFRA